HVHDLHRGTVLATHHDGITDTTIVGHELTILENHHRRASAGAVFPGMKGGGHRLIEDGGEERAHRRIVAGSIQPNFEFSVSGTCFGDGFPGHLTPPSDAAGRRCLVPDHVVPRSAL